MYHELWRDINSFRPLRFRTHKFTRKPPSDFGG